ncbi:MAG: mucoidy inhibitor MuiA family protein [Chitinophagales bacterium]
MKTLDSKIIQVAVFTDRAQVTRMATATIETGNQTLVFDKLPQNIEANSLQVTGAGNAVLKDVKLETKHFVVNQNERLEELQKHQNELQNDAKALQMKTQRLESARLLVENIAAKITATSEKATDSASLQPEKWLQMIDLHQTQLTKIDADILVVQKENQDIQQQLDKVRREMNSFGQTTTKTQKQVQVVLEAKGAEEVVLKLSYVVYGAAWYPVYDVRVNSDTNEVILAYKAMVSQRTGEDWEGIGLELSTAQPHISGEPPMLGSWFLSKYVPPRPESKSYKRISASPSVMADEMSAGGAMKREEMAKEIDATPMEYEETSVDTKAASVVFGVGSKTTILSDNQAQQVNILQKSYKTEFVHIAVPSKSAHAYLKANITNDSEYPLLKGESNIFMDNHFVAKSNIPFTASGADFEIGLGIDEAVKVTYKTLQNLRKTVGFIKNKEKMLYAYETVITNSKKREIQLTVHNQIPISNDNDIEVTLIEPVYESDTDTLKKNDLGHLEWEYTIERGEEKTIPLKYSVTYHEDITVIGL